MPSVFSVKFNLSPLKCLKYPLLHYLPHATSTLALIQVTIQPPTTISSKPPTQGDFTIPDFISHQPPLLLATPSCNHQPPSTKTSHRTRSSHCFFIGDYRSLQPPATLIATTSPLLATPNFSHDFNAEPAMSYRSLQPLATLIATTSPLLVPPNLSHDFNAKPAVSYRSLQPPATLIANTSPLSRRPISATISTPHQP